MIHTSSDIVGLVAGSGVPCWCSTSLALVGRIGARCIWLLVGAQLRDVPRMATSEENDLPKVVGVVPSVIVVIGVVVSWPGIGILLRLVARTRRKRSGLLWLIRRLGRGFLPGTRLLVAGTAFDEQLALATIV